MKKICILLCLCILSLSLTSCIVSNEDVSTEVLENYASTYKEKMLALDPTLNIDESTLMAQNGDYVKTYSVSTSNAKSIGVWLTIISPKKAKLDIEVDAFKENWTSEYITLFVRFISELSNYNLQSDKVLDACERVYRSKEDYAFNMNARISQYTTNDDVAFYYREEFRIDLISKKT